MCMKRLLATLLLLTLAIAQPGPVAAGFYEGEAAYKRGDYALPQDDAEAARWFRKAAEQGNAKAQYRPGNP